MNRSSGRKSKPFLWTEDDFLEEQLGPASGEGPEGAEFPVSSPTDRKLAAEIAAHLESELDADLRRIHFRVAASRIYVQGTVASREIRERIEEILRARGDLKDVVISLTLASSTDD